MTDATLRRSMAKAIQNLKDSKPIVVHGGGPFIQKALDTAGLEHHFLDGLRVTSKESLPVIEKTLTMLGKTLAQEMGQAISLTGRDNAIIQASLKDEALGFVGTVAKVNKTFLEALLELSITPVLACIAANEANDGVLNVNADEVAGAVAASVTAPAIFLTNVPGVLDDPANPDSLQKELSQEDIHERISDGRISSGMIPKVQSALTALRMGASYAVITDGQRPDMLLKAIQGQTGTRITL